MRILVLMVLGLVVVACGVNTEPILGTVDGGVEENVNFDAGSVPPDGQLSPGVPEASVPEADDEVELDNPDSTGMNRVNDAEAGGGGDMSDATPVPLVPDGGPLPADGAVPPPDAAPDRDTSCDDGNEVLCDALPPECEELEVAAAIDGCWACVNAVTCRPWGEPGCETNADCGPEAWCNGCATGSCPFCEDCVAGCTPHDCDSEPEPACDEERPDCADGEFSVVRGGCWICVDAATCEPGVACIDDHECGLGTCRQEAEVCITTTPLCVDERCDEAEQAANNQFCRDGGCGPCQPGDEVLWTCPGGLMVPWCRCDAGGILCVNEPSAACAED